MKNIFLIAKKELKGYFDTPTAYIVLVVFLLLWQFLFFRNVFLYNEASVRLLFDSLPWLFLFLIPAITMSLIVQEKVDGTMEFMLTHPVKATEVLFGKLLSSVAFVLLALLFSLPIVVSLSWFGSFDWGVYVGQMLGGFVMALMLISVGLYVSSLVNNAISSLLISALISFVLIMIGSELFSASLPFLFAPVVEQLSIITHFQRMARGIIDLRDVWYFLSASTIFFSLAYLRLLKNKFGNNRKKYLGFQTGVALFIGIAVLTNVVGSWIPGRIDLTQGQIYSLSDATKTTLTNLKDLVNINLYISKELPVPVQPILRDIKDMLRDYQTYGKGNIVVNFKDPSDTAIAAEAKTNGIQEVQFNVMGAGEFQLKKGYLGLTVAYAGSHKSLPYVQDTSDLEYQLTSFIRELTNTEKKRIVFLAGHGEKDLAQDYPTLQKELSRQFEVTSFTLDAEHTTLPEKTAVLVIAGPTQKIDDATRTIITNFQTKGGSVLFLIDPVTLAMEGLSASPNAESFADFVAAYGVTVNPDLVYDLRSNEIVTFGGGASYFLSNYPFWPRALALDKTSLVTKNIESESLVFPWSSSLSLNEAVLQSKKLKAQKLFGTTPYGGRQVAPFNLSPDQQLPSANLGEQILAVSLSAEDNSVGRMIILGSSGLLTDALAQRSPESIGFGISAISWLAAEESLASIQLKQMVERKMTIDESTRTTVQYGNMGLALFLPLLFGGFILWRRKNMKKRSYISRS